MDRSAIKGGMGFTCLLALEEVFVYQTAKKELISCGCIALAFVEMVNTYNHV